MMPHAEPSDSIIARLRDLLREARWLWPNKFQYDNFNHFARIGKVLELSHIPEALWAAVSADQSYQLHVNGRMVCRGPARGYQSSWPFDVVDIAPFLRSGKNIITARVYSPGEGNFAYICKCFPGFIFAAEWQNGRLLSDDTWGAFIENANARLAKKSSTQLFRQEHIDLAKMPGDADPVPGNGSWQKPYAHHSFADPWPDMEHRAIPLLKEEMSRDWRALGHSTGRSAPDWSEALDVVGLRFSEGLAHMPISPVTGAAALRISGTFRDNFESYLIDFGKVFFGSLELIASGQQGGECVDILYAESADENTLALELELDGWNHVALGSRLRLAADAGSYRFYNPYGFRFAVITVRNAGRPLELDITLHSTGYPLAIRAEFQHDNARLMEIWRMCVHTQEVCALDAFVDTPWREQAQWWGDARYQGRNVHWLSGDNRLYKRGIYSISAQRTADGLTYGLAPGAAYQCVLPDFSISWVLTVYEYYFNTGDISIYYNNREGVAQILRYFMARQDKRTGLVSADPRYWNFLDWAPVYKGEYPAILNFMLLLATQQVSELARLCNDDKLPALLGSFPKTLMCGLAALKTESGLYSDGRDKNGAPAPMFSCVAQMLAALTGIEKPLTREWVSCAILPALDPGEKTLVRPNLHWMSEAFDLLAEHGYAERALEAIESEWGAMLKKGGIIERRDFVLGRHSFSHAWASHPVVHFIEILGGIRQTAPAWAAASINPVFIGNYCDVSVPTPHGALSVSWKRCDERIEVRCEIPEGIDASTGTPLRKLSAGVNTWTVSI